MVDVAQSHKLNLFNRYYKTKYKKPVGKIAFSTGQVCPNRRAGGCIYCDPASFTPFYLDEHNSIAVQRKRGEQYISSRKYKYYFAYFQQETTTAGPTDQLLGYFEEAVAEPTCIGLIISARPDYLEDSLLEGLANLASKPGCEKEVVIELGLQSAHDATLHFLNRNHTFADYESASRRIKQYKQIQQGVHLIVGLPKETVEDMLLTVKKVCGMGVDAIKFHHLQVIRNTRLHQIYLEKPFAVYSPWEYMEILARLIGHVPGRAILHRLWSSSDPKLVVQPDWGRIGAHELHGILERVMEEKGVVQGGLLRDE